MDIINHDYFAALLAEQDIKRSAFDAQLQLELLGLHETSTAKLHRHEYMKFLAARIVEIEHLLTNWANAIEFKQEWLAGEL